MISVFVVYGLGLILTYCSLALIALDMRFEQLPSLLIIFLAMFTWSAGLHGMLAAQLARQTGRSVWILLRDWFMNGLLNRISFLLMVTGVVVLFLITQLGRLVHFETLKGELEMLIMVFLVQLAWVLGVLGLLTTILAIAYRRLALALVIHAHSPHLSVDQTFAQAGDINCTLAWRPRRWSIGLLTALPHLAIFVFISISWGLEWATGGWASMLWVLSPMVAGIALGYLLCVPVLLIWQIMWAYRQYLKNQRTIL